MPVVETMAGMYVISSLSSLVSSALNTWSSHKNRQSSERISALSRDSSEEVARLSREHSAKLQYNQLKFSVLQQRENQDFQRELAELSHERLKEIEAYRAEVNFAINQKNLDFQKWSFEQRKIIEYDILQLQQNFQRDLSQIQHQNALIQMRERMRADKSPINNLACDLLENSFSHGIMPLKVFLAPPILDYDPSTGKPYNDSYESFLAKEIEQFLHQGYLNSKQYPVQLLDGSWVSKKQGGGSALQSIHAQLKSIPVLILESKIPLGELNLSLGYWNSGDTSYTQASILSGISFSDLLRNLVKQRALEWEVTRKKLEVIGKDEAYIKTMGGVNEENLQVYYKELAEKTELESLGIDDIDTSNLPISKQYKTTEQDYKSFYQYLAVWHCLVIGLYADILFLGNSWENTPLLPSLIPYLLEKYKNHFLLTPQFWQEAISEIVTTYGQFYDSLKSDASSCLPEIRMKLALSLANLPNEYKYLALKQCDRAITDWLVANNVPSDKIFDMDDDDDIQLLKGIFYQEDKPFLDSIKQLLVIVNEAKSIDLTKLKTINSLLDGWKLLSRFGTIPALPQVKVEVKPISEEKAKRQAFTWFQDVKEEIDIELVNIPAGSFMMGDDDGCDNEKPAHRVTIKAFQMSKYPITQKQYRLVMGTNPSRFQGDENCPVENVSWHDAVKFCEELSKRIGQKVKLPTEAQWEYACRAGSTGKHCFGDDVSKLGNYAWYDGNSGRKTHPVGEKLANSWGLHDMCGNVWEWCEDVWHENYNGAPSDGSAWLTGGEQDRRALRGGSWSYNDYCCRSAIRFRSIADGSYGGNGFRVVV
jgi:formylglycine-generating enzyme required for sulfatase activity